jgi:hypothetical protein
MDILKYINENYVIIVAVLYVLGVLLKNSPKVPDWTIPWILLLVGVGFSVWMGGFSAQVVIQGFLVAGAAVMGNQLFKQTLEGKAQIGSDIPPKELKPTGEITEFRK